MKKAFIYILLLFILLLSCSRKAGDHDGKTVFRYNEASGITSLDPAFAKDQSNIWACNQLYNGLVQLNDQLGVEPCIARNWSISADGRTYTFHLRQDVYFHDHPVFENGQGRRVVAHDFLYSFSRIVDPGLAFPGAWVFNKVLVEDGRYAFYAPNDTVFVIKLSESFPPFLGILGMQYCTVVPHEVVGRYGKEFRKNPVGTGPFRFRMWKEGVKLVYIKNDHYFEFKNGVRLPYLDAVAITFMIDKQSAFLEFVKGNLDFMSGIDATYKDELLTKSGKLNPRYDDKFKLLTEPYLNTEYLGILVDTSLSSAGNNPLMIKEVRQALNYGIDRARMMKYLRNNIGYPGNYGIIPSGMPAFDLSRKMYYYDPDKSRHLLARAGYPNGENMGVITLHTTADYLDLCKYIQHQLSELGVNVEIEVNPPATLRELKAQSKLHFFRASWIADYPDEENYLSLFYSQNFSPGGPNYTHFSSPEFDSLYNLAYREVDPALRTGIYRKMNDLVMEDAPVIILYYDQVLRFVWKNVHGLGSNPMNLLTLKKVSKDL